MIGVLGDLLEDIVVTFETDPGQGLSPEVAPDSDPAPAPDPDPGSGLALNLGADTAATIERRSGGSAATVALAASRAGTRVRFIGQIGDDDTGRRLIEGLEVAGVEVVARAAGVTGTVVVLLHRDGERSMLTDRGAATQLADPQLSWLDGLEILHVPLYSLASGPLAATTVTLSGWAAERGLPVCVDLSSTTLLRQLGDRLEEVLETVRPALVLANEAEAALVASGLGLDPARLGRWGTVVKRGPAGALLHQPGGWQEVPAVPLGPVADSTGAGDAFAAGLLGAVSCGAELPDAVAAGHRVAADHLGRRCFSGPAASPSVG